MNDWQDAEQRVERAQQLAESRLWQEALVEIDAALEIQPQNGGWQAHRGYLLDQLERFDEAIDAYRALLASELDDQEVRIALGVDLARTGRYRESIDVLALAGEIDPELEAAYCYRILSFSELGEHDEAEQMFYLAQQLREDCPHCFYHIGGSLAARGDLKCAVYCWGRTLDIDPNYPSVKACIAQAYREQGQLDRAREYFLAEVRQDPGNVDLLFDMAELELEAGQPSRAAAKLRQIVELDPEYAHAHFALGEVLLQLNEPEDALAALRASGELDPDLPRLHLRLGQSLFQLDRFREAVRHLSAAYAEEPGDESVLEAWGSCLLRLGRPADAAEKFRRVLSVNPGACDAAHNLGVSLCLMGDLEEGLEHLLTAVEANPEDLAAMHKVVLILTHLGRWREAREMMDRALLVDPHDAPLRQLRDRLWRHRLRARVIGLRRWLLGLPASGLSVWRWLTRRVRRD